MALQHCADRVTRLAVQELPLPALYQRARAILKQLDGQPASGPGIQQLVADGTECLRHAASAVDALALFSANEDKDDLATADIKYLLIPFYQAEVLSHTHAGVCWGGGGALLGWWWQLPHDLSCISAATRFWAAMGCCACLRPCSSFMPLPLQVTPVVAWQHWPGQTSTTRRFCTAAGSMVC